MARRTRRRFLHQGIAAGAAFGIGTMASRARAAGETPPNERIAVGVIGVGGRGNSLLGEALGNSGVVVKAVCDVDAQHMEAAGAAAGPNAAKHADYRKIIERDDIDAVVVATPDHWHTLVTVEACAAKKDVYVEKPLSTYIPEGRAMVNAARKYARMVQVGIHHRSAGYTREIAQIVRSGRIGKVRAVKVWMWANPVKEPTPPGTAPAGLDFNRWLGPAPEVPYHPARVHFNFRWCRDYAGGYMTDWGVHMFNVITYAMQIDDRGPKTIAARGTYAEKNLYDFPLTMQAQWEYADPAFTLSWIQPEDGADAVPGEKYAMTFYGEAGELRTFFGGWTFFKDGKEAELPPAADPVELFQSPGHFQNWIDSIRSRKLPLADVEVGHRTTSACILGNIALWAGRPLTWDWQAEKFVGDAEADKLLFKGYRAPYTLNV